MKNGMSDPSDTMPQSKKIIDCHVHVAALSDGNNGCYVSSKLLKSPLFRFLIWKHGLDVNDPHGANQKYVDDLRDELRQSRHVGKAVLLAMDGVYDGSGNPDQSATELLVGNDYILHLAHRFPETFLAGVSINPQRRDAIEELHRCADNGAALVKVLPNSQQFDPANVRYKAFYRAMAQRHVPLLSHVGYEFSLIGKDQSVGDPNRLRVPLEEGVTVIAAHACSYGLMLYEKFYSTLLELVETFPNFYADVSALTLPNRFRMLLRLRECPEVHQRLLFGTDYPLSVLHLPAWGRIGMGTLWDIINTTNRFDRQFKVCQSLGVRFHSFERVVRA